VPKRCPAARRCPSKKPIAPYDGWQEVTLPASTPPAWACADPLSLAFFTRMLHSCLVDADFIGGGVVHLGAAFEPQLEGVAVFADVVEPRGKFGLTLCPEGGCEGTGQSGSAGEMVVDGLGAGAVLADVGKTCGVLHKMTS